MITALAETGAASRMLDAMPFAVIGLSRRDAVTYLNPAAENLLGRSAPLLLGRMMSEILTPDASLIDYIGQARRQGGVVSVRGVRLASSSISPVEVDVAIAPEGEAGGLVLSLMPARPNPDEKAANDVAAFAQIARMLGHEVKNPLAGIVGAAQLLARKADDHQQPLLTLIREEGLRIQRIVDRFSAFETFFSPRMRMTNVHEVLDSVVSLARASFAANATLDLQYDPSLPEFEVDPDHLHEACLNLVKNAAEASADGPRRPRLIIATRYRAGFRFNGRDLPFSRGALEVSVTDNGPGVPETAVARIFEPFFTTKSEGAGVGLAVVQEIMTAHGGHISLDNSPGGACFRLQFPLNRTKGGPRA
jgi:two-component system nitrogen regulation sensor histidine kinase GlnL